jgi:hypothetical protein
VRSVIIVLAVSVIAAAAAYSILHVSVQLPRSDGKWLAADELSPTPLLFRGLFSLTKEVGIIGVVALIGRKVLRLRL